MRAPSIVIRLVSIIDRRYLARRSARSAGEEDLALLRPERWEQRPISLEPAFRSSDRGEILVFWSPGARVLASP